MQIYLYYQSPLPFHCKVRRPQKGDAKTSCVNDNKSILVKAITAVSYCLSFGA